MSRCPDPIELSSWHDGENASNLESHVSSCQKCEKKIEAYVKIDNALKCSVPDSKLADKIMNACICEDQSKPALKFVSFLKIAAAAMVILAIGYSITADMLSRDNTEIADTTVNDTAADYDELNENEPEPTLSPNQLTTQSQSDDGFMFVAKRGSRLQNLYGPRQLAATSTPETATIELSNARLVSVLGSSDNQRMMHVGSPTLLPRKVKHIWVVKNLETAKKEFLALLPDGAVCSICKSTDATNKASICITVELGEKELQKLVDALSTSGWALVSAASPQPGESNRLLLTGEKISYSFDLVVSDF